MWEGPFSPDWSRIISVYWASRMPCLNLLCTVNKAMGEAFKYISLWYDFSCHHHANLDTLESFLELEAVELSQQGRKVRRSTSSPSSCTKNDLRACKARVDVRGRRVTGQTNQWPKGKGTLVNVLNWWFCKFEQALQPSCAWVFLTNLNLNLHR